MKKIIRLILFSHFLFFAFCTTSFAQYDLTMYNMQSIPQSMYGNPAFIPKTKVNIGLPVISSVYLNLSNNGFVFADLVKNGTDGSPYFDTTFVDKLGSNNYLSTTFNTDILSFGFRVKKNYFSFNATEKINFRFRYPKDFFNLLLKGNGAFLGQDLDLGFALDANHYREYGLGMAREINDKLVVGGKLKYLYGMESVNTEKSNITLRTDENSYDITAKSDFRINTSFDTTFNSITEYALKKKNKGFGIDLGANYKLNNKFSFSASVIDLGFIKWASNVKNYYTDNSSFTFEGIPYDANDTSDYTQKLMDSLQNAFTPKESAKSYTTYLTSQVFLGARYHINEKNFASVLLRGEFYKKSLSPSLTIAYNTQVQRWLYASASYSILNRSYNNLGFGFSINLAPLQLYVVSDNILGALVFDKYALPRDSNQTQSANIYFPAHTKNLNVRFGINLTFGRGKKDRDKDGVADRKDDCPDVAGLAEFQGCPDKDGDGVPDKKDDCPDVAGLKQFNGCPDTDGDGIPDKLDSCPDAAGTKELNGCPDTDSDGVIDKDDECPDVAGLQLYHGCPDTDADGIIDKNDECPKEFGLRKFKGCPDTDNDGIPDKNDKCPNDPGLAKFKGCPDRDNDGIIDMDDECPDHPGLARYMGCPDRDLDGVPDKLDSCPDTYGTRENKGCPLVKVDEKEKAAELTPEEQEILKNAFDNLQFESGKAVIREFSKGSLDTLVMVVMKKKDLRLYVSGHTDNVGNAATNKKLSQSRAKAVKDYFASKGIDMKRIIAEGFGATRPVADNKTQEGKQKNRRVEMKIIE